MFEPVTSSVQVRSFTEWAMFVDEVHTEFQMWLWHVCMQVLYPGVQLIIQNTHCFHWDVTFHYPKTCTNSLSRYNSVSWTSRRNKVWSRIACCPWTPVITDKSNDVHICVTGWSDTLFPLTLFLRNTKSKVIVNKAPMYPVKFAALDYGEWYTSCSGRFIRGVSVRVSIEWEAGSAP
jgi:hypothetical protein